MLKVVSVCVACALFVMACGAGTFVVAQRLESWHPVASTGASSPERFSLRFNHAYPMDSENAQITQLIVVVHGASAARGDYDGVYFDRIFDALGSELRARTQIIAPHFRSLNTDIPECDDGDSATCMSYVSENYDAQQRLVFSHGGWREGASTTSNIARARVSSFRILDDVIKEQIRLLPNLRKVVITGHSAGGQFVNRYTAAADFRDAGVNYEELLSFVFIPANPSSVFYIDERRPDRVDGIASSFRVPTTDALPAGIEGQCKTASGGEVESFEFASYRDTYNDWKYGLNPDSFPCPAGVEGFRTHCHTRNLKLAATSSRVDPAWPDFIRYLVHNIKARRTVYLVGNADTVQNGNLDDNCEANLLGISRFIRAQNFAAYWNEFPDWDNSTIEVLDGVAHSGEDVYRNPSTNGTFMRYVRDAGLGDALSF